MTFEDDVQTVKRELDEIVKGSFSAHNTRHQNGGGDEVSIAGLSGQAADNQNPTAHAAEHVNGTDDIQNATAGQKGVATAAQITKLDGIEALADVTDPTNVNAAGATMNADTTMAANGYFLDDDTMAGDDATKVVSQQSLVAYINGLLLPDIRARAYKAAAQLNFGDGDWTKLLLDTESYDIGGNFDVANNEYVVDRDGLYLILSGLVWDTAGMVGDRTVECAVYVDPLGAGADAAIMQSGFATDTNSNMANAVGDVVVLNDTDEVSLYGKASIGANTADALGGETKTFLTVILLREL